MTLIDHQLEFNVQARYDAVSIQGWADEFKNHIESQNDAILESGVTRLHREFEVQKCSVLLVDVVELQIIDDGQHVREITLDEYRILAGNRAAHPNKANDRFTHLAFIEGMVELECCTKAKPDIPRLVREFVPDTKADHLNRIESNRKLEAGLKRLGSAGGYDFSPRSNPAA